MKLAHRIPPDLVWLIAAVISWGLTRAIPAPTFAFMGRPFLALAFALVGITIVTAAIQAFRLAQTTINPLEPEKATVLITTGIYQVSRNPMYLGMALLLLGQALWLGHFAALLPCLGFILYINRWQIVPEEQILRQRFGETYLNYSRRTRRWL